MLKSTAILSFILYCLTSTPAFGNELEPLTDNQLKALRDAYNFGFHIRILEGSITEQPRRLILSGENLFKQEDQVKSGIEMVKQFPYRGVNDEPNFDSLGKILVSPMTLAGIFYKKIQAMAFNRYEKPLYQYAITTDQRIEEPNVITYAPSSCFYLATGRIEVMRVGTYLHVATAASLFASIMMDQKVMTEPEVLFLIYSYWQLLDLGTMSKTNYPSLFPVRYWLVNDRIQTVSSNLIKVLRNHPSYHQFLILTGKMGFDDETGHLITEYDFKDVTEQILPEATYKNYNYPFL